MKQVVPDPNLARVCGTSGKKQRENYSNSKDLLAPLARQPGDCDGLKMPSDRLAGNRSIFGGWRPGSATAGANPRCSLACINLGLRCSTTVGEREGSRPVGYAVHGE